MVKVLRCHNFCSQSILPVQKEPICLSSGGEKLFVGTSDSSVEVFQCKNKQWSQYCSFQTGAPVTQIVYNEAGDYVATIEKKSSRRTEVVSVKIYLNWSIAHYNQSFRTRVRVASLGYRSTNVETGKRLEVVDIPCEEPAQFLTTCQQTGNLGLICGRTVKLYHLVEKTIPNSATSYLDMVLFLDIQFVHDVTRLSLCEDYVACAVEDFVQVFQVVISHDTRKLSKTAETSRDTTTPTRYNRRTSSVVSSSLSLQQSKMSSPALRKTRQKMSTIQDSLRFSNVGDRGSSTPSPALSITSKPTSCLIEDDAEFVHWEFTTPPDGSDAPISTEDLDVQLHLPSLDQLGKEVVPEPVTPYIRDLRGGNHLSTGRTTLKQVLYRYLDKSDHSWIHVELIPTYLTGREGRQGVGEEGSPTHSCRYGSLAGMSCLVSGTLTGFMYSLVPGPTLLSTYKYSTDARQMQTNGRLLYVMVENGLETYTARCAISAIHNTHKFNNITEACPGPDLDICMCGVQQFMGASYVTVTGNHVILLNKMVDTEKNENVWNVYALEDSSTTDLYKDMIQFGSRYQQNAANTYHYLLLEGFMTLKSSLIGQAINQLETSMVQDLLLECCALLGEYYAMPNCPEWSLCLPYYLMSCLSPIDVVRQALQYKQHSKQKDCVGYGKGLMQYLKYVLFEDKDPLDIKASDCDLIVAVCSEMMPDRLADVILFSRVRHFSPEKAQTLLRHSIKQRPGTDTHSKTKDILALVSLHLQLCEPELALSTLSAINKADLIDACVNNHQVLHVDLVELSPLSQLVRCHCPEVLIHILVLLYERGTISMDLAIQLLQGTSGVPEIHRNTHVRDYLEALINDDCRRFCYEEAVPQLCDIYIRRLLEWEPPSIRQVGTSMKFRLPKGSGHFGPRHGWLDKVPPFTGAESITKTCKYVVAAGRKAGNQATGRKAGNQAAGRKAGNQQLLQCQRSDGTCSCFLCNEDLLKLQSVLCYNEASQSLSHKVLSLLNGKESTLFYNSVYLLCSMRTDLQGAILFAVEKHPAILAEFGLSVVKHDHEQWSCLLNTLLSKVKAIKQSSDDEESKSMYLSSLKDVLQKMAVCLKPEQFLAILPGDGNFFFFMPYIQLCMEHHKSAKLGESILAIGDKLATTSHV